MVDKEVQKVGNGCKMVGKKGRKSKRKETVIAADDNLTGYKLGRVLLP